MGDQVDVMIVGAGVSGLMAASELAALGKRAVVLDKGRSVGGRLATRRVGDGAADTGAQFFSVRTDEFRAQVHAWLEAGLVFEWSRGWSDGSLATVHSGHPRYAVYGGMSQLAKHLAQNVDVRLLNIVSSAQRVSGGWRLNLTNGEAMEAPALLLTPPVPQSLILLREGSVTLPYEAKTALERIDYNPSVCGLFVLSGPIDLPSPGAIQRPNANLFWLADNQRKGISPGATVLTAQASPTYSRALYDVDDEAIIKSMKLDLMPYLGDSPTIVSAEIKRWRYAMPVTNYPAPVLMTDVVLEGTAPAPLAFAGDAFGGARIEGAYVSGKAAAHALAEALK
ncbi:MAG TPA: FAD-dependent oxidoreductase [Candidatus Limnocylindrales bacterium]|nr:FAD-dependent oxidoreductase [Candidatus Limnocylindrales bacterium]